MSSFHLFGSVEYFLQLVKSNTWQISVAHHHRWKPRTFALKLIDSVSLLVALDHIGHATVWMTVLEFDFDFQLELKLDEQNFMFLSNIQCYFCCVDSGPRQVKLGERSCSRVCLFWEGLASAEAEVAWRSPRAWRKRSERFLSPSSVWAFSRWPLN